MWWWCVLLCVEGWYLPGVRPVDYSPGDLVDIKVTKLDSVKTQLPYEYYRLPFCPPVSDKPVRSHENLGEYLTGERIESSAYVVKIKQEETCKIACRKVLSKEQRQLFETRVVQDYRVNMILDDMPAFVRRKMSINEEIVDVFEKGFPVGFIGNSRFGIPGVAYLFNHLKFIIHIYEVHPNQAYRIVGFEVEYFSIKHHYDGEFGPDTRLQTCSLSSSSTNLQAVSDIEKSDEFIFTYDVVWKVIGIVMTLLI